MGNTKKEFSTNNKMQYLEHHRSYICIVIDKCNSFSIWFCLFVFLLCNRKILWQSVFDLWLVLSQTLIQRKKHSRLQKSVVFRWTKDMYCSIVYEFLPVVPQRKLKQIKDVSELINKRITYCVHKLQYEFFFSLRH